jgi:hypothetical protein
VELPAVRFTLDEWMLRLHNLRYDDPAYPALAESCKSLIWDTALQVLRAGSRPQEHREAFGHDCLRGAAGGAGSAGALSPR